MGTNMMMAALRSIKQPTISRKMFTIKRKIQGLGAVVPQKLRDQTGNLLGGEQPGDDVGRRDEHEDHRRGNAGLQQGRWDVPPFQFLGNQKPHQNRIRHCDGCRLGGGEDARPGSLPR